MTNNKANLLSESLPLPFKFLKENYVLRKKGIHKKCSELYQRYEEFCHLQKYHPDSKCSFFQKLKEYGIESKMKKVDKKCFRFMSYSHDQLYAIFKTNHWINEYNEIKEEEEERDHHAGDLDGDLEEENQKEMDQLKKENERLKRKLRKCMNVKPKEERSHKPFGEDHNTQKEYELLINKWNRYMSRPQLVRTKKNNHKKQNSLHDAIEQKVKDLDEMILQFH